MDYIRNKYVKRKTKYDKLREKQIQTINFISVLRMIIFILGVLFTAIIYYKFKNYYMSILIAVIFTGAFIYLAVKHQDVINNKEIIDKICYLNDKSIKRLDGKWRDFEDTGKEFIKEDHNYSKDLDIFGRASLFQYLNATNTYMGRRQLKSSLENPNYNIKEIYERQEATKELSKYLGWRQRFQAEGLHTSSNKSVDELIEWGEERDDFYTNSIVILLSLVVPIATVATIIMYFMKYISYSIPIFFMIIQGIMLRIKKENRDNTLKLVYKYKKIINSYYNMLELIGKKEFKSKYLKDLKLNIMSKEENKALNGIDGLIKISSFVSDRNNMLYLLVNVILLWDYQCMILLEKWNKEYGSELEKWLDTIGKVEEISSLSIITHDNPDWVMPKFNKDYLIIKGKNLGHPLLGKERICNDFQLGEREKVLLITGSNMSGKSTLLRTVGVNLVLAYAGGVVCAEEFYCTPMYIYTCMRISDNLEKNISSFYGEILRIKKLIEGVKTGKPIFFLLDEIFKGTNSLDRHTGAEILINKLSKENVLGIVSTHDLELGDLEKQNGNVRNYHFREYYKDNRIYFDYKLRLGISTTRNALYLMKMAGIEIDENNI
ncbi:MutS family DNA mismatch repair protein [Clostridium tetani]|uniref:MutS family DNA mismatch repair protein n=1 Tax=Clostridium tetani TaxID=1513 RepID=UPI00100C2952|nr:MutS family DNA mismatch repair protein [Clostridium tetani]RXM59241.1 DNA mismatch repair protein [Clostridium tetani]RXM77882.1 DNA mismatch repair protein [Clostridium tetani]RYU99463.1 DNA mismatch repair protein [Clostridium tetani]